MAQCQTNPDGRCTMEPPCRPGECYLYGVLADEHAAAAGSITEDAAVARALVATQLPYPRGPYTEGKAWRRSALDLVNAVIDTVVPGGRLVVESTEAPGAPVRVYLGQGQAAERPRDLARSLRELADWLDGSR